MMRKFDLLKKTIPSLLLIFALVMTDGGLAYAKKEETEEPEEKARVNVKADIDRAALQSSAADIVLSSPRSFLPLQRTVA